jgi:4'-phosphopantetheinyl transferase
MPLYKSFNHAEHSKVYIWHVTETYEELFNEVKLNDRSLRRVSSMKSEIHQRAFLSVRKLLQHIGLTDFDLYYDDDGKPNLRDGRHISITHSFEFAAIIISDSIAGIDMEQQRDKIGIIARKFVDHEFTYLRKSADYIKMLTVIWGAKEAIFKIRNEVGISFKDHIKVADFQLHDGSCRACLQFKDVLIDYNIYFLEVENYMLVYAFENR